ncbi:hypothetical protein EZBTHKR_0003 [Elizabethkingia anophelis]|nr:hypothetical protein EZBTHKR_0003 [Elizabethkingia anophelis]
MVAVKIFGCNVLERIVITEVLFGESICTKIFHFQNYQKIAFILIHSYSPKRD